MLLFAAVAAAVVHERFGRGDGRGEDGSGGLGGWCLGTHGDGWLGGLAMRQR